MKLLITGGAGFIGSNFIRYVLKKYKNYKIFNLDKLTYCGNLNNLRDVEKNPRYYFFKGDICDKKIVEKIFSSKKLDAVINFAAESITGDTYLPVWTSIGIRIYSFEELFRNLSRKNKIEYQMGGVEVINLNSKKIKALAYKGGIGYWEPIRQISRHKYKGKIVRLNQKWGEIEATPNHSIYDINFVLTTPKKNPELLGLRNINHISKKVRYKNYKGKKLQALLRVLGAYISDGWSSFNKANGAYQVGIANTNKEWIEALKKDLSLLGYNSSITKTKKDRYRPVYQLSVSNKSLFNFLRKEVGHGHKDKKIPSFIFDLQKVYQEEFLKSLVFGDGERIKNKNYETVRYTTTSKRLATGLSLLLTLLKYNYSVVKDRRFGAYTLNFGCDYTNSLLTKNYEEINYDGYVYDISVEKLENFVCGVGNLVVHNSHVDRSILDPNSFIKTNIFGTYTLLEAARKNKIKKFIQIGTDEEYGSIKKGYFKEEDPLNPSSPYSASKAGASLLSISYFKTFKTPVIVTRSTNNFGPYQYPEKIIPLFITNLLEGKKLPLYGRGLQRRDWLYVLDNCRAIDLILHKGEIGEIYNVSSGNEFSNKELTKIILKEFKKDESWIEYVKDRPGHDFRYGIDCRKIKKLGWRPIYKFSQAIKATIKWYRENEWWWKPIKFGEFLKYYKKQYGEKTKK